MPDPISPMSPQDALIAVTFVTAISDDLMSEKEYREITATVNLLPVFKGYDTDRIDGIIDTVQAILEEDDGVESLVGLVKSALPDHLHETAYALACDVAAARRVCRYWRDAFARRPAPRSED